MNVPAETLKEQTALILRAWGMEEEPIRITAEVMVDTDMAGIDSHGVAVLTMYEELRSLGRFNFRARPRIVREGPVTALIDADSGLGHPAGVMGMELAIKKALASGVAAVSVINSAHYGAAGYYAALAPPRGLIGMATTSTRMVTVVPTGASAPVLGTNPIAFAAPARRHAPFLLDMSTSTVAVNKVRVYALAGKSLPEGWVTDGEGRTISVASVAMDHLTKKRPGGGLSPVGGSSTETGGHKGYGLGAMVQILSSTLGGGSFSPIRNRTQAKGEPDNIGHFFMAIDPKAFRDEGLFEDDLDAMIECLHGTPASDPSHPVLVAGEPESVERERRRRDGIPVSNALADQIRGICGRCGAPFILDGSAQ